MTYNNPKTNYPTRKEPAKLLTDYSPELALNRTRFYLDVIEAHLEEAHKTGTTTIRNPFRVANVARLEGKRSSQEDKRT
jgi:hypothetical protein